jgi:hypothetical protein
MLEQNHQKKNGSQILNHQQNQNKMGTQLQSCCPHTKQQQNPQKNQSTYKLLLLPINKTTKIRVI